MSTTVDPKAEARRRALAAADIALVKVKQRISLASLACLRRALDAEAQVKAALDAVEAARAALRDVADA